MACPDFTIGISRLCSLYQFFNEGNVRFSLIAKVSYAFVSTGINIVSCLIF